MKKALFCAAVTALLIFICLPTNAMADTSGMAVVEGESLTPDPGTSTRVVNVYGGQALEFYSSGEYARGSFSTLEKVDRIEMHVKSYDVSDLEQIRVYVDGDRWESIVANPSLNSSTFTIYTVEPPRNPIVAGNHTIAVKMHNGMEPTDKVRLDWIDFHYTAPDGDTDNVPDSNDNCPNTANPEQEDLDGDGQGDACDSDIDGDRVNNDQDYDPYDTTVTEAPTSLAFNSGYGKGSSSECTTTISSGSIEAAGNKVAAGGVLCVRGGVYTEGDQRINLTTSGTLENPKKIKAYPGERVEIRASIRPGKASNWVIEGVFVDASYSPVSTTNNRTNTDQAINFQNSENIRVDGAELINRRLPAEENQDLAGTCVFGGSGAGTGNILENSYIHQCGKLPRDNLEHCVYAGKSKGLIVRNNWIADCANRSVQLYVDTDQALVEGNLIDSDHNQGIVFNGGSDNNTVQNNVINTPNGDAISTGGAFSGSGNLATDNCVWDLDPSVAGDVTLSGNIAEDPLISGHKVTNSICAAKLPADSVFK